MIMNFSNKYAFLNELPLSDMSGKQKFLAVAVFCAEGQSGMEVTVKNIKSNWSKTSLGRKYNASLNTRAKSEGWVNPIENKKGVLSLTEKGIEHLKALYSGKELSQKSISKIQRAGGLSIFNRKKTHTFDKFLRGVLASSKNKVMIADSWVDGTIFDTVLDVVPKTTTLKFLYAKDRSGNFVNRAKRFKREYQKFEFKKYKKLHDRFLIIDKKGYVLGLSIKDAADNSPTLVVELDHDVSQLLEDFFKDLWKQAN